MCTEQEEEVGGGKEQPRQGEEQKPRHSRTEPRKLGTVLSPAWGTAWRGGRGGWKAGAGLEESPEGQAVAGESHTKCRWELVGGLLWETMRGQQIREVGVGRGNGEKTNQRVAVTETPLTPARQTCRLF